MKTRKPSKAGVRVRQHSFTTRGKKYKSYHFSVPPQIAEQIPPNARFVPELCEEGVLFRIVKTAPVPKKPSWI